MPVVDREIYDVFSAHGKIVANSFKSSHILLLGPGS